MEKCCDFKTAFIKSAGLPKNLSGEFFRELSLSFRKEILRLAFLAVANGKSVNVALKEAAKGSDKLCAVYIKTYRAALSAGGAPVTEVFNAVLPTLQKPQILRLKRRFFYLNGANKPSAIDIIDKVLAAYSIKSEKRADVGGGRGAGKDRRAENKGVGANYIFVKEKLAR